MCSSQSYSYIMAKILLYASNHELSGQSSFFSVNQVSTPRQIVVSPFQILTVTLNCCSFTSNRCTVTSNRCPVTSILFPSRKIEISNSSDPNSSTTVTLFSTHPPPPALTTTSVRHVTLHHTSRHSRVVIMTSYVRNDSRAGSWIRFSVKHCIDLNHRTRGILDPLLFSGSVVFQNVSLQ